MIMDRGIQIRWAKVAWVQGPGLSLVLWTREHQNSWGNLRVEPGRVWVLGGLTYTSVHA
jgi:hypothetical protein